VERAQSESESESAAESAAESTTESAAESESESESAAESAAVTTKRHGNGQGSPSHSGVSPNLGGAAGAQPRSGEHRRGVGIPSKRKRRLRSGTAVFVELRGIEPLTSALRTQRSPS
jgi:hypothetical protein